MISLESIGRQVPESDHFRRPPTDQWHPQHCGDIDIVIDTSGQWFHEGSPIRRAGLLRLLASVLVFEDDAYWLKTPVEKMRITVADQPFVVTELAEEADSGLSISTSVGEHIMLRQPWRLSADSEGVERPHIDITPTLGARLSRNLYYHLCQQALDQSPELAPEQTLEQGTDTLFWRAAKHGWPLGKL